MVLSNDILIDSDQDSVNVLEQSGSSGTSGSPGTKKDDSTGDGISNADEIGNAVPLVDTVLCFVMNGLNTGPAESTESCLQHLYHQ